MFGPRLKELRKKKLLTQKELAIILNIDRTSIGKYETREVVPSPDLLIKIADYFDVTLDYLLGRYSDNVNFAKLLQTDSLSILETFNKLPSEKKEALKILLDINSPTKPTKYPPT